MKQVFEDQCFNNSLELKINSKEFWLCFDQDQNTNKIDI